MKTSPVVMGLDLSVAGTGYAISDLDGVTGGVQKFTVKASEHQALRFHKFEQWFQSMLQLHQPDVVLYEESNFLTMASNHVIQCAASLSGRVEVLCAVSGIPTKKIMPDALKRAFIGDAKREVGKDKKYRMKNRCLELFPDYDVEADKGGDESDARALIWCYLNRPEVFERKPKKAPKAKK